MVPVNESTAGRRGLYCDHCRMTHYFTLPELAQIASAFSAGDMQTVSPRGVAVRDCIANAELSELVA